MEFVALAVAAAVGLAGAVAFGKLASQVLEESIADAGRAGAGID